MTNPLFRNSTAHADGFRDVDPLVLSAHVAEAPIIDVREPHEFNGDLGHVLGARLVPLGAIPTAAVHWDREKEIVVLCRSGGRSAKAARILVGLGFKRVMNMRGGMLAWDAARLPVERVEGDAGGTRP